MEIPRQIGGLRLLTGLVVATGLIWMALEGQVRNVLVLAAAVMLVLVLYGLQRWGGGHTLLPIPWLVVSVVLGLVWGAGSILLALGLMAVKTGIHAHGPEFTAVEIGEVWALLPLWSLAGTAAGLGLGALAYGLSQKRPSVDQD